MSAPNQGVLMVETVQKPGVSAANAEIILEKLRKLGPEFQMGFDVPRIFVSGSQIFGGNDMTMIVFREQNIILNEDGQPELFIKNRASVVMQTEVAKQLRDTLIATLEQLEAQSGAPSE